ncbi:hypothetical protein Tco_0408371 [Tanacetum coccineum]
MEAELGTCQTEIALLKSKNKIGGKRELLNHDLENVMRALGNVLERMSVLESWENATLKKRLAETETKLVLARMECETAERRIIPPKAMFEARMREVIREQVSAYMAKYMANMNRRFDGAGAGGAGWFDKLESVFRINDCKERDKVKFATATLQDRALTWWNGRIASMGIDAANDKTDEVSEGEKRKGEGDRGGRGDNHGDYNRRQNQRRANAGAMTNAAPNDNEVCPKCKNKDDEERLRDRHLICTTRTEEEAARSRSCN